MQGRACRYGPTACLRNPRNHPQLMSDRRVNVSSGSDFEERVGYSRAVRTGPHVVVAGTTGAGGDIAAQAREALRRIEMALEQVGASLSDVVRTRMFVTDIGKWREVGAVHAEVFGDIRPVTTMVEVSALISPELMVEIEADAHVTGAAAGRSRQHPAGRA
jgi:enamine deaminase RidA (YjgF/YER057c/UK114 family)